VFGCAFYHPGLLVFQIKDSLFQFKGLELKSMFGNHLSSPTHFFHFSQKNQI
jgi:hypothetical protein